MFDRKPARLLNNNGLPQKLVNKAADQSQETEEIGYQQDRGLLGQPSSFYVGIGLGIVFQAALITISIAMA